MSKALVKRLVRNMISVSVLRKRRRWLIERQRASNAKKSIHEVFGEIYDRGLWGRGDSRSPCSGSGSSLTVSEEYCETVRSFIRKNQIRSVLDIGCGDFEVGRYLRVPGVKYIGVDIVPWLIERNKKLYEDEETKFYCLDAIKDPLPDADLCLVRQVLQHLSNSQIMEMLQRLSKFNYIIVTEHYPSNIDRCVANLDKPHGPDTRVPDGSAVFVDRPPFDLYPSFLLVNTVLSKPLDRKGETIRTFLLTPSDELV